MGKVKNLLLSLFLFLLGCDKKESDPVGGNIIGTWQLEKVYLQSIDNLNHSLDADTTIYYNANTAEVYIFRNDGQYYFNDNGGMLPNDNGTYTTSGNRLILSSSTHPAQLTDTLIYQSNSVSLTTRYEGTLAPTAPYRTMITTKTWKLK